MAENRRGLALRVLSVSFVLMASVLTVVSFSQNAAAVFYVDYYDRSGYAGDFVVYMTTGITDTTTAPRVTTLSRLSDQPASVSYWNTHNAVQVLAGQPSASHLDPSKAVFAYYYQNFSPYQLIIKVPIAAAGASDIISGICAPGHCTAYVLGFKVSQSGAPSVSSLWRTEHNSGVNTSQPGATATDLDVNLLWLGAEGFAALSGAGFAVGAAHVMYGLMKMVAQAYACNTGPMVGDGTMCQYFDIAPDFYRNRNHFSAQTYVEIDIPSNLFTTIRPTFSIAALNWMGPAPSFVADDGAAASVSFQALPAVTVRGTVRAGNDVVRNQDIVLETVQSDPYDTYIIHYHLKTDSAGQYRFFAELGKAYTLSTTYSTPFGPASVAKSFTTPTTADSAAADLTVPSLSGYVRSSVSPNNGIQGAKVIVTSPVGATFSTTTDSSGYYSTTVKDWGTYSLAAQAYGYAVQTRSKSVSANAAFSVPDFSLIPQTPDFSLSTCGSVSVYTSSSGQCSVTVTSLAGWSGTVTLSATISPVVSGGPTISGVSPVTVTVTSFGQTTSFVTISAGTATGTFTVTVVGISGSLSRSATFTVTVSNPPPSPRCTPQRCPI